MQPRRYGRLIVEPPSQRPALPQNPVTSLPNIFPIAQPTPSTSASQPTPQPQTQSPNRRLIHSNQKGLPSRTSSRAQPFSTFTAQKGISRCLRQLKPPPPSLTPSSPPGRPRTPVSKPCHPTRSITVWPRPNPPASPFPARKPNSPVISKATARPTPPPTNPKRTSSALWPNPTGASNAPTSWKTPFSTKFANRTTTKTSTPSPLRPGPGQTKTPASSAWPSTLNASSAPPKRPPPSSKPCNRSARPPTTRPRKRLCTSPNFRSPAPTASNLRSTSAPRPSTAALFIHPMKSSSPCSASAASKRPEPASSGRLNRLIRRSAHATLSLGMLSDLKLVIRLQEIATLPKHIAEIEKRLTSHERKLEADRAALSANQKERKKCEGDIQVQEQKISKLKDQMLLAKTNEQYRAFQSEIDFCQKEIRRAEDRILELMTESEPLDKNVKAAEAALKVEKAEVEAEKQKARERTAVDERASQELQTERGAIAAQTGRAAVDRYERVRKARKGIGVAEVIDGRCSACNLALRLQLFQELKRGDEIMACESCLRILYYNPPVKVEDLTGEAAHVVR